MSLAILCSGGDAPGMNPAIKKFVDYVYKMGETPYFIYDGLEGMIDGNIRKALHADVAGILHNGGAIIGSSRSKRFYEKNIANRHGKISKNTRSPVSSSSEETAPTTLLKHSTVTFPSTL